MPFNFFSNKKYDRVSNNTDLVNKYNGQNCFILGCGPSIKNQKISLLKNENVIGLSTIYYHDDYKYLSPLASIFTGYSFHSQFQNDDYFIHEYQEIEKFAKGLLFFEEQDYGFIIKNNFFRNKTIRYYKSRNQHIDGIRRKPPSLDRIIYAGQNIAVFAIQIAISMGFKKIYLLGLDHDWIYHLKNKTYTKFNPEKDSLFNKFKITDFDNQGMDRFSFWIDVYHKLWSDYKLLKWYAEKIGVNIINITDGGLLDVFERNSFDNIIRQS
jgi:hypothetical protein